MNTRIRSIGFAAFGAVALTMVSMEEPQNVIGCTPGGILTSQECQFEALVWDLAKGQSGRIRYRILHLVVPERPLSGTGQAASLRHAAALRRGREPPSAILGGTRDRP